MRNRFTKIGAGLAVLAALALGGATLASAGGSPPTRSTPTPAVVVPAGAAADAETNDTGQKADAETADGTKVADTDSIQSENGKDDATEQPGSQQASGTEKAESGSEAPGNDCPGGHADEPGSPNADHQFEGQE